MAALIGHLWILQMPFFSQNLISNKESNKEYTGNLQIDKEISVEKLFMKFFAVS